MKNRKIIITIFMSIFAMNIFGMNYIVQAAEKTQDICLGIYNQELWISDGIPKSSNDAVKVMDLADENTDFLEKVYFSPNKKNLGFFQEIVNNDEGTLYEVNLDTVRSSSAKMEDYAIKIDSGVQLDDIYVYDDGTVLYTKEEDDGIEKKICYFDGKSIAVIATEVESFKVCDNAIIYSVETSSSEEKLDEYITGEDLYVVEKDDLNSVRMIASNIYDYKYYVYDMEHIFYAKVTKSMREFLGDEGDPIYALYVLDSLSGKETKIGENVQNNSKDTLFKYDRLLWTEDDGQDAYLDEFIEDDIQTSESEQYMQSLKTSRCFNKPNTLYSYNCITNKIAQVAANERGGLWNIAESNGNWALMFLKKNDIKLSDVIRMSQGNECSIEYAANFLLDINSVDGDKLYISFNGKKPQDINVDIVDGDEYIYVSEFSFDTKENTVNLKTLGVNINSLQEIEERAYTAHIQGGRVGDFIKTDIDITDQEEDSAIEYDPQIFMNKAVYAAGTIRLPNGNKFEKEHNDDSYVGTLKLIKSTGETNVISDSMKYWCLFENGNIIYTDNNMLCFWDGKKSVDLGVQAECFVYYTMAD